MEPLTILLGTVLAVLVLVFGLKFVVGLIEAVIAILLKVSFVGALGALLYVIGRALI